MSKLLKMIALKYLKNLKNFSILNLSVNSGSYILHEIISIYAVMIDYTSVSDVNYSRNRVKESLKSALWSFRL